MTRTMSNVTLVMVYCASCGAVVGVATKPR